MKKKDFDKYIDEYYTLRENSSKPEINEENAYLYSSLDSMDFLKEANFTPNLDILSIIDMGDEISQRKKERREFLFFLLSAFLLMSIVAFVSIYINENIFIYMQIFIIAFLPLVLIPLAYFRVTKEDIK